MKLFYFTGFALLISGCSGNCSVLFKKGDTQETRMIACEDVVSVLCAKSEECGATDFKTCVDLSKSENVCSNSIVVTVDQLKNCSNDIRVMNCSDPMPLSCLE